MIYHRFEDTAQIKFFIEHYVEIKKYNEKKLKEAEQKKSLRRFLPPGYITGTPYKVIIATFVYFLYS